MNRVKTYQPLLPFPAEVPWDHLPEAIQEQAQELLSQMLSEVVRTEGKAQQTYDHEPGHDWGERRHARTDTDQWNGGGQVGTSFAGGPVTLWSQAACRL